MAPRYWHPQDLTAAVWAVPSHILAILDREKETWEMEVQAAAVMGEHDMAPSRLVPGPETDARMALIDDILYASWLEAHGKGHSLDGCARGFSTALREFAATRKVSMASVLPDFLSGFDAGWSDTPPTVRPETEAYLAGLHCGVEALLLSY